ncbi:hypothetical protein [Microbacterium sp. CFBP9034]|uniref:hypothetical protein n=1 Tax=Microbacterium sp. CFBP9034 TaxID=3096540 RepID=UPI002A6B8478|nr:hypothetical protein [Microbacterium sp. CFBP9034]MDY0910450.1 hypothetical protein [Microbacterium sp. CFBP9034]
MKTLTNGHGAYLTGTAIADSVMTYGLALAQRQQVDLVEIPFIAESGAPARVQLTIGWLTDYASTSSESSTEELTEIETITLLRAKAAALDGPPGRSFTSEEVADLMWDDVEALRCDA